MRKLIVLFAGFLAGCASTSAPGMGELDIGLGEEYSVEIVANELNNPSGVSFRPDNDALTIADAGNGRVLIIENGKRRVLIDNMVTEYWKKLPDGTERFLIGPLATMWIDNETLLVAEGGYPDSEDCLTFFRMRGNTAELDGATIGIPPTTPNDPADLGEGNFIGLDRDGDTVWICSHGNDKKTWIAKGSIENRTIEPWLSADDNGIATNSPMQALIWNGNLLVLYSGEGGKDDGMLVEWNTKTRKPLRKWTLKGLTDPMGMAWVPDTEVPTLVVTDNNWDVAKVKAGRLALVTLGEKEAQVKVIASKLQGPVNCAFGPDGRLYIACVGPEIDGGKGMVIAVDGLD